MKQDRGPTGRRTFLKGASALGTAGIVGLAGCAEGGRGGNGGGSGSGEGTQGNGGGSQGGNGGSQGGEQTLVIGTAASATANYAAMQGFGAAVNENSDEVYLDVRPNDGMAANVGAMNRGEFDLALLTDYNAALIREGKGAYANIDYELSQLVKTATTEWLLISNSEDIRSYDDIGPNTRVGAGPSGTSVIDYIDEILGSLGIEYKQTPVGFGDIGSALAEGRIDVGIAATNNAPTAAAEEDANLIEPGWVQQIKSTVDAQLLGMNDEQFSTLEKKPGFTPFRLDPALLHDGYAYEPNPVPAMVQTTYLCGPTDTSYDAVHAMLKTAWEQRESMGDYHDFLSYHRFDDHWTRFAFEGIPFHAGAADLYKEVGIWSDDLTAASKGN